ncbi:putative Flp pilus-assembly TadE/G-like protein [Kribbella steppae]|uniref:Putative Flp pilus-assembly TadE/G-like protein n=1 Tax=Kribbella steppae TaxID=2512223 RepID=A0A4R2HSH1_9ACTN|nr:TadE/TadG family type IV pilus assembly protein [Kribbella steppae]TCO34234.1 putative Flp pilus-assembly TadE/G-like protein [Kribbella steppae]
MRDLVPPFVRPMMRLLGRDDRGAFGVLIGMLLGSGVLLGMAALTIDVGTLYQERAELQNGADSGSIAVAKSCVITSCTPGTAATYANLNAKDGVSAVTLVCGHDLKGGLPGCPGSSGAIYDCPSAPASGTNYVDVHTATLTTGGSSLLPPVFARALAGNAGYAGSTVLACARAMWGPALQTSNSLAMTLSLCAWTQATGGTPPTFGTDVRIFVRDAPNAPTCAGLSRPGEFGWLSDVGGCTAQVDLTNSGYITGSDPGKNISAECQAALTSYVANQTPIFIPIFDTTTGSGSGASYHLVGLAAFILTGYVNMNPLKDEIPAPFTKADCPNGKTTPSCIFGHFTQALVPMTTTVGGGTYFGATAIKLAG